MKIKNRAGTKYERQKSKRKPAGKAPDQRQCFVDPVPEVISIAQIAPGRMYMLAR